MPKGNWSFLHEWVIYDYLKARSEEGTLRLRQVILSGKLLGKRKWVKVEGRVLITGTAFPDIQVIKLVGEKLMRPAEVKFTTSLFAYHKEIKYKNKFAEFVANKGFILVAAHDYVPDNLLASRYPDLDVFELEIEDFITFCRENFSRLLNRQIKQHITSKVWLMYQGPNFNEGNDKLLPANQSLIWCPTEDLTGFDLAIGDRILFFKTQGSASQSVQKKYLNEKTIDNKWMLKSIFIGEISSKIFSREEYHQYKKHKEPIPLWKNDPLSGNLWRWNRVFEFKKIKSLDLSKPMVELFDFYKTRNFVVMALEAFCFTKSREVSQKEYRDLIEYLLH